MKKNIFAVFSICLMLFFNVYFEHEREMGSPKLSRIIDEGFIFESGGGSGPRSNGGGGPKSCGVIVDCFIFESAGSGGAKSNGDGRPRSSVMIVDNFIFESNGGERPKLAKLAGMTARVNEIKVPRFKEYPLKNG